MIECSICKTRFTEEEFNSHPFKAHKIKVEDYFTKGLQKKDLFTGERIPFRSPSQYVCSDFLNLRNLRYWVKSKNKSEIQTYCLDWLFRRKEVKDLRFVPSQFELKSLVFPPAVYLETLFQEDGGYSVVAEGLGYIPKLKVPNSKLNIQKEFEKDKITIIQDTRESLPLKFKDPSVEGTLGWGDYGLLSEMDFPIRIERKSLADALQTFGKNYERFCREVEKAGFAEGFLVVLIESKFDNLLEFPEQVKKHTRVSPDFILHRIRELNQNFANIQFIAVDGRREAARVLPQILKLGQKVRSLDLQAAYDLNLFC